jgi:predicted O-methyltransferase YrrM
MRAESGIAFASLVYHAHYNLTAQYPLAEMTTLSRLHASVLAAVRDRPQAWDPRMVGWLPEGAHLAHLDRQAQRYYLYLNVLVRQIQPNSILELGTCEGGSAFFMILALPDGCRLTTIDISDRHPWQLGPFLFDHRLRRVKGNSLDINVWGAEPLENIDLLFIDTLHEYEQVRSELALYLPHVRPGGIIVLDDIHLNGGMKRVWSELNLVKFDTGTDLHWSGFGIAQA